MIARLELSADEIALRLAALPLFASALRSELDWVASRAEVRRYDAGATLFAAGAAVDEMVVLLEGRVVLYTAAASGAVRRALDAGAGEVLGVMPYSRLRASPASLIVEQTVIAVVLPREVFSAMVIACPSVVTLLVHHLIDRSREYHGMQLNIDRLESLGRLAAGLAHELNNPASAVTRDAEVLAAQVSALENAAHDVAMATPNESQMAAIDAVRNACDRAAPIRTTVAAADHEDAIAEWLTRHGADAQFAGSLASCDLTLDVLDRLASAVPGEALGPAIKWIASAIAARDTSRQIRTAATRIHDLVATVKGFTFMDRQAVPEDVDVARGLVHTVALLKNKARTESVTVRIETNGDLPRVFGFGSEMNQVWEKLIDNAIDAAGAGGTVVVSAAPLGRGVVVRITDTGPGIPSAHRARVFDPFFTTKPVGRGTGLGLDLARRIVHVHCGDIDFTTEPGCTTFRVELPATGARGVSPGSA